ncbi:WAP four-disulfide core domain protein 1 [Frankliniella fusca]|uniref:WAP four-disulfide core domain protein 1 n=1 Tax=Frankliniella fusca TaxID=407009 RepID=A0AAE1LMT8_9NEOP|nr:WAP four-disulfide core domain protein 1 [Frankliniella fusca]
MSHMLLLLAALAALIAAAPGGPARPQDPQDQQGPQGQQGAAEHGSEYGAEYEDDDEEEDDASEDEYASSGQHGVEQLGDKPARPDQDQGLRRGRHVHVLHHHADGLGQRRQLPEAANKAISAAPHVVFEETTPRGTCPPAPPAPRGDARCRAERCERDSDCAAHGGRGDRLCCSNGCVRTCQRAANPPLVVDWEGETPDVLHPELPWPRPWTRPEPLQYHHGAAEVVVLPGGCSLPPSQYQRIVAFMRRGRLKNW